MNDDQFDAITTLLRMTGRSSLVAARMILVDGVKPADAAELLLLSRQGVSMVVTRIQRGMVLARRAAGLPDE